MDRYRDIYSRSAADYHRMIAAEDADGRLLPALLSAAPAGGVAGARLLDVGSGTGRIPLLLRGRTGPVVAVDLHRPMLLENARQRQAAGGAWALVQADARELPVPSGRFDLVTAGWAFGHFCSWYADDWRRQVGRALAEMRRAAAPGGTLVVLETLGTGASAPAPPKPVLADYYRMLETEWGFLRAEVSTDYRFDSPAAAEAATRFFFGDALAEQIRDHGWSRIPEWTGVWTRRG